jgi:hypothetical protein
VRPLAILVIAIALVIGVGVVAWLHAPGGSQPRLEKQEVAAIARAGMPGISRLASIVPVERFHRRLWLVRARGRFCYPGRSRPHCLPTAHIRVDDRTARITGYGSP